MHTPRALRWKRALATTSPGVPRWAAVAARTVPFTTLPSGIWRLALGIGIPVGFSGDLADLYGAPGWITPYVIALSLLAEGAALLTLGLVQPWGERLPGWVPRLGGRRIPTAAAAVPAALGALAITTINWTSAAMWFGPENNGDPEAPHGVAGFVMAASYAPMLAWGPLLGAVTVAYCLRRRRQRGAATAPAAAAA
ncbi:MAG TPA: hypothetical protein VFZ77_19525 [Acidimicrobiales bacterium]